MACDETDLEAVIVVIRKPDGRVVVRPMAPVSPGSSKYVRNLSEFVLDRLVGVEGALE